MGKKELVLAYSDPLKLPDDLIGALKRAGGELLTSNEGELLVFFEGARLAMCRSFLQQGPRWMVDVKRCYRERPKFTLQDGMGNRKAYLFGACRIGTERGVFAHPTPDLACPWCEHVGKLTVHSRELDPDPNTEVWCTHCHREASVKEHVPPSHHHELVEWLVGIPTVEPYFESRTAAAIRREELRRLNRLTDVQRFSRGLGNKPKGQGPLADLS